MTTDAPQQTLEGYIAEQKARLEANPQCGVTHYNLGVALLSRGDYLEAEREFREAVTHSPTLVEAYVQLGGLAMRSGDLEGCLNYNKMAAEGRPMFATPQGNIGFVYMQMGQPSKAARALERAVKLDPNFIQALATLGNAYLMEGDLERAEKVLRQALEKEPLFGPAWNNLALVMLEAGQPAKAVEYADKALETGFDVRPELLKELEPHRTAA
ncbi:tetratricopeptide repeat protein [Megalodesulfovibrio paquesii]